MRIEMRTPIKNNEDEVKEKSERKKIKKSQRISSSACLIPLRFISLSRAIEI